ncbi:hypothetical protein OROGR_009358 [Orobanche gracilis]
MRMELLNDHYTTLPEFIARALEYELTANEISKKQPQSTNKRSRNQTQADSNLGTFKKAQSVPTFLSSHLWHQNQQVHILERPTRLLRVLTVEIKDVL